MNILDPYRMVAVSIIASLFLFLGVFVYRYIYPKKKINLLVLLILISLLPCISMLRPGTYESGDLSLHATEAISFFSSLSQGIIFPRWAGELNATYGYPAFMFIYPLPYYFISFFHLIGLTFINSTKLLLGISFVFSGIGIFYWIKKELNEKAGFIAAIFYLFAPYHLVDFNFRADVGEMLAFALIPINLLLTRQIVNKPSVKLLIIHSIFISLLIMSHPAISLAVLPVILTYSLFCYLRKSKKNYIEPLTYYAYTLGGILISAFYWLPTLLEIKFTHQSFYSNSITFQKISEFIYSPWRYGFLFQGPQGQLSFIVGYIQLFLVIVSLFLIFSKRIKNPDSNFLKFALISLFIYFFLMLELSRPVWYLVPFIKNFQFTYRLMTLVSLLSSVVVAIILYKVKSRRILITICFLAIFTTILNWGNRKTLLTIDDAYLMKNLPVSTSQYEGLPQASPIWTSLRHPWINKVPTNHLDVISGHSIVVATKRTGIEHDYSVAVQSESVLQENTLYFPGWTLYVDGHKYLIQISKNPQGAIDFSLPKGKFKIKLKFEDTQEIIVSKEISFIAMVLLVSFSFYALYKSKKK